jgi:AcrR family transcriptional regulator
MAHIMGTKGDSNRQRIVDAADELFYTRGYNQTSFRDISDMTGIPRGNFYYYFKTKDEILGAVVDSRLSGIQEFIQRCDSGSDDPRERLLAFTDMLEFNKQNVAAFGCPIGSLTTELAKDNPQLQQVSQSVFDTVKRWMDKQFTALGFDNAEDRSMDLLARMQGITVVCCAFKDVKFLERSHAEIKTWINSQTLS